MLALNIASERYSLTAVVERTAWLRRLDSLGRLGEEPVTDLFDKQGPPSDPDPE
jgi:hypothetical protein